MGKETRETLSFLARMIIRLINNNCIAVPDMDRLKRIRDNTPFKEEQKENIPVLDLAEDKPVRVRVCGVEFDCYMTFFTRNIMATVGGEPLYHVEINLEADMVSFPRNFPEG